MTDARTLAAGDALSSAAKTSWPTETWWTAYQDPQLDKLVARAIAGNPGLQAAKDRIVLAQSVADVRNGSRQPQLELDAYSRRERFTALQFIPPPWAGGTYWNNSVTTSMSYDLDLWGRRKGEWQASLDEARAVSAEAQQVRIELENAVVRGYVRLSAAYERHDVAARQLDDLEQRVEIERRRESAGMGTQLAVSKAEASLPLAQADIESIDEEIIHLKSELAALAGEGPGALEGIQRPKLALEASVGLPDRLPASLVGRRPDVTASRWRVESMQRQIDVAKAAYYPDVNLLAVVGFQALGFGQWLSNAAFTAGAGPALSLPLFDGGKRRAGLSAATSAYDVAVDRYNDTVIGAIKDVSDQLVAFRSAAEREKEAADALKKAQDACAFSLEAYKAGLIDYRGVLDADEVVLKARDALSRFQAQRLEAYARLMLALGGGAA